MSPRDPAVFAAVPTLMLIVAAFASYLPALAATRINALDALRTE